MGFRRYMRKDDASMLPLSNEVQAELRRLSGQAETKEVHPNHVGDHMPDRDGKIITRSPLEDY